MQNKRGISAVVGTMVVLLLTILVVGILWYFVNTTYSKSEKEINANCLNLQLEPVSCKKLAFCAYYFGGVAYEANVTVKRYPGEGELSGVRLIFENQGQKNFVSDQSASSFIELQSKAFKGIIIGNNVIPDTVKVAALTGDKNEACPITSSEIQCPTINTPPQPGPIPGVPTSNDCCQHPWNLTTCDAVNPGGTPGPGQSFCCSQVPTPTGPGTICTGNPSDPPATSCCIDSLCGLYPPGP